MSTISDSKIEPSEEQAPENDGHFERGLRTVFILLILVAIFSGYATRPTVHRPVRRVLQDSQVIDVIRHASSWQPPILRWAPRPILVRHQARLSKEGGFVSMESAFTTNGRFLGSKSMLEPPKYVARTLDDVEKALERNHERYEALEEMPEDFSLTWYWERIDQDFDLRWLTSFRLFPALFYADTRKDQPPVPVVVLHMWCSTSDSQLMSDTEGYKRPCPQARRIVLDLIANEIIRNDYLL